MSHPLLIIFHSLNTFLSTIGGELLKRSAEFVLLLIATYMITSEFGRHRYSRMLKYLLVGFSALAVSKFIMMFVYANAVFLHKFEFIKYFPILDNSLEIIGLVMIVNAFLFMYFRKNRDFFSLKVKFEAIFVLVLFFIIQLITFVKFSYGAYNFNSEPEFLILNMLKIFVLLYPLVFLLGSGRHLDKHSKQMAVSLIIYAITPALNVINFVFFNNASGDLRVLAHPFPFIAMALFLRVVYLKMSDKAALRRKLHDTQEKYEKTKELSELKDEFVSVVSHELKTPLTSISLYSSLLMDGKFGKLGGKQKDTVSVIKSETARLSNLINDILSLSKLENKTAKMYINKINLLELLKQRIPVEMAKQKGLKVIFKIPKNLEINIDEDKFTQVAVNLFSNAVKFTAKGKISFIASKTVYGFLLCVEDTGVGISEEELPKLFDKFYQIDATATTHKGGTGLGLAIVKGIVGLHGGEIKVESELGKGTKIIIGIPQ
jgi:signal transduction histidine kinase